ncbi:hypothetical protein YB2330_006188 [Saitoella coloradoensis]
MPRTKKQLQIADHVDTSVQPPSKRRRVEGGVSRFGRQLQAAKRSGAALSSTSQPVSFQLRKKAQEGARIGEDSNGRGRGRGRGKTDERSTPPPRTAKQPPAGRSSSKDRNLSPTNADETTTSTPLRRGRSRHMNPDLVDTGTTPDAEDKDTTSRLKAQVIIKPLSAKMRANYAKMEVQPEPEPAAERVTNSGGVVKRKRGRRPNIKVAEDDAVKQKTRGLPKKRTDTGMGDAPVPRSHGRPSRTSRAQDAEDDVEDELVATVQEDDDAVVAPILPRRRGRPPKELTTKSEEPSPPEVVAPTEVGPRKSRRLKMGGEENEILRGELKRKTPRRRNKGIRENTLLAGEEDNLEAIPTPRRGSTSTLQPDVEEASDVYAHRSKRPRRTVIRTKTVESMRNDPVSSPLPTQTELCSSIDVEIGGDAGDSDGTSRSSSPNVDEHQTTALTSTRIPVAKPIPLPLSAAKKNNPGAWNTTGLLTDRRSLLLDMDVHNLFTPQIWDQLPAFAQNECLELLPDIDKIYPAAASDQEEPSDAQLRFDFFHYNSFLSEAIDDFTACLSSGTYAPSFLRSALVTNAARADGLYDSWKASHFESYWGQKQRLDNSALAGDAKGVKLGDVMRGSNGVVGDVWVYDRIFTSKKGEMRMSGKRKTMDTMHVRKEVTLTAIDPLTYALTFSAPEGQEVYAKPDTAMVTISDVLTPNTLEHRVLDIDGRLERKERPNGNAWKCFRVRRNKQDLGTLFESRQRWYGSTLVDGCGTTSKKQ